MLGVLVIIATTVLCINTFVRCKDHLPLLFLGIWMWFLGLLNGVMAVHVALLRRNYVDVDRISDGQAPPWIWFWFCESLNCSLSNWPSFLFLLFFKKIRSLEDGLGVAIGLSGLISFFKPDWRDNHQLRMASLYFIGVLVLIWVLGSVVATVLLWKKNQNSGDSTPSSFAVVYAILVTFLMVAIHLAPLYSDVALGIVTDNLFGLRRGSVQVVFWFYFFVQRLTMLSL
jgi:hypothetical protein